MAAEQEETKRKNNNLHQPQNINKYNFPSEIIKLLPRILRLKKLH